MNMSPFQLVVTAIFIVFIIIGVGVFAVFGGLGGSGGLGAVSMWGTLSSERMERMLAALRATDRAFQDVTYEERNPATYHQGLVSAMAAGRGPDLFFINHEDIATFSDKILTIPYSMVSQRSFVSSFIDQGQLFLSPQGSLALPVLIDPLVMYWNRDLFAAAGIATPPRFWNDFLELAPRMTSHDAVASVRRSTVAMGEWRNIANAKAILSALIMQAGDPIIMRLEDGTLRSALGSRSDTAVESPGTSALRFYTEFANPSKTVYSWNRSFPEAQDAFVAGDVGVYFGFASEYETLRSRNPNLQIGVEPLPQIQGGTAGLTFGRLTGVAVSRWAKNPSGAAAIAQRLAGAQAAGVLAQSQDLLSARRDVVLDTGTSAILAVFAQSSLMARGWLDPSPRETDAIFQNMVESVSSGRATPSAAIADATRLLEQLLHTMQ